MTVTELATLAHEADLIREEIRDRLSRGDFNAEGVMTLMLRQATLHGILLHKLRDDADSWAGVL